MLFIWGSYAREATLHEVAMCKRCNKEQNCEFKRVWRTGHFFFFPLFSYGHAVLSRCQACGREGVAYYPKPLPPLPLLDRLGWLFPASALGLVFVLLIGVLATPSKPRSPEEKAGSSLRMEVDRGLSLGDNTKTPEEAAIAKTVGNALASAYTNVGSVHVGVRLKEAGGHKRVVVLVHMSNLRHADDGMRGHMLDDVRVVLADALAPTDEAIVAIEGRLLYGAMAQGPVGAPWKNPRIAPAVNDELDVALAEFAKSE